MFSKPLTSNQKPASTEEIIFDSDVAVALGNECYSFFNFDEHPGYFFKGVL